MDGFLIRRLVHEVGSRAGAVVQRVRLGPDVLLLALQDTAGAFEMGLAIPSGAAWAWYLDHGGRAALGAEIAATAPEMATPFAGPEEHGTTPLDALRAWMLRSGPAGGAWARLAATRLVSLAPRDADRVLLLGFETEDVLGARRSLEIVAELFDRAGNLVLHAGRGAELANWRARRPAPRRVRPQDPPASPGSESALDLASVLAAPAPERALAALHPGLGWLEVRSALDAAAGDAARLADWLARRRSAGDALRLRWTAAGGLAIDPGGATPAGLSLAAAAHLSLASQAAEDLTGLATRAARRDAARLRRLVEKLDAEAAGAAQAERWRQDGELLAANLHRLRRGESRVTVEDFFAAGAPRDIDLDPQLTPQENVASYFKRARRAARGRATIAARRDAARAELAAAEHALDATRGASGDWCRALGAHSGVWRAACAGVARFRPAALWAPGGPAANDAPAPSGTAASRRGARRGTAARAPRRDTAPGRRIELPGGWEVRVGRSNADNDALTHDFARPDDIWLHASGVAGSHVLIRMQGRAGNPPRQVLEAAAAIAARFSKAKHAGTVPVLWTRKRYVRKPRGAKPGLASCTHEKTLFVRPALPPDAVED